MATPLLTLALERRDWSLAALCLLLGVANAAAALPPETLESLLEPLEGAPRGGKGR